MKDFCPASEESNPPDSFRTVVRTGEAEWKVQRSRFISLVYPVKTQEEARARLEETSRRFHDARHVCYGFMVGVGQDSVRLKSDAGEPAGTAGEPILTAIAKLELTDVLVVVVRYFGGVKLGTGGLARAYGQAASLALDQAGVRVVPQGREFLVRFPYSRDKSIRRLLETRQGKILDQHYGQEVVWRIWLPHSVWRGFAETLTELTAGTVILTQPPA